MPNNQWLAEQAELGGQEQGKIAGSWLACTKVPVLSDQEAASRLGKFFRTIQVCLKGKVVVDLADG